MYASGVNPPHIIVARPEDLFDHNACCGSLFFNGHLARRRRLAPVELWQLRNIEESELGRLVI